MSIEFFGQLPPWVLGTVSQSGGIPTGGLIEAGSNANGDYVKFADGTMIAWGRVVSSGAVDTAVGSIFGSANLTWTFPVAFVGSAPVVSHTRCSSAARWGTAISNTTTSATLRVFSAVSNTGNVVSDTMAVGRWF